MIFALLLTLALEGGPDSLVRFEGTEVFQPLVEWEVEVAADGRVFIINFSDAYILRYSADGEMLGKIGRKGRGPGEFSFPWGMWLEGDTLYAYDFLDANISEFNANDGRFIRKFKTPGRGLVFARINDGWLYADWEQISMDKENASLVFAGEELASPKTLMKIAELGEDRGMSVWRSDGEVRAKFSPISTRPKLIQGPDGMQSYVTDGTRFKITVVKADGTMREITRDDPRIPFDEDWAKEELAKRKERNPDLKRIETNFPESFPVIREMKALKDGTIVVDRWRGRPGSANNPIAIDQNGKEVPMPYSWEVMDRLVGETENHFFLITFTEEGEEGGVARVLKADANKFVTENPVEFEGEPGHSISISD